MVVVVVGRGVSSHGSSSSSSSRGEGVELLLLVVVVVRVELVVGTVKPVGSVRVAGAEIAPPAPTPTPTTPLAVLLVMVVVLLGRVELLVVGVVVLVRVGEGLRSGGSHARRLPREGPTPHAVPTTTTTTSGVPREQHSPAGRCLRGGHERCRERGDHPTVLTRDRRDPGLTRQRSTATTTTSRAETHSPGGPLPGTAAAWDVRAES